MTSINFSSDAPVSISTSWVTPSRPTNVSSRAILMSFILMIWFKSKERLSRYLGISTASLYFKRDKNRSLGYSNESNGGKNQNGSFSL